jgi:23S rRNA (pseudouridine1915-N3)-methyltransferase
VARGQAARRERTDRAAHLKLRVIWTGKTRDPHLAALTTDLSARIGRFVPLEIVELKDPKAADTRRQLDAESRRILAALTESDRVVALDAAGKSFTSAQFAGFLGMHARNDPRHLTFVIGGYGGLSAAIRQRAELLWSLSPLTFTHEMARFLAVEQIYRALAALHNHPYSK